jgi:hypothetical protein
MHGLQSTAAALLALCMHVPAQAHDTWFEALSAPPALPLRLALGTGNRFPAMEFPVAVGQLQRSGCRSSQGTLLPLAHEADEAQALKLRLAAPAGGGLSCWAQIRPFTLVLEDRLVGVYFKEIQPPAAVQQQWAEQRRRGQPWTERYAKNARIELPDAAGIYGAAQPSGMGLDLLLVGAPRSVRAGDVLDFQLLRDGLPLAGQALELHGDASPLGFWRRTDAQGRVRFTVPLAGRWILRGTELRRSESADVLWESRFVTLAFEVGAAPVKTTATRD